MKLGAIVLCHSHDRVFYGALVGTSTSLFEGKEITTLTIASSEEGFGQVKFECAEDAVCEVTYYNTSEQLDFVKAHSGYELAQAYVKKLNEASVVACDIPFEVVPPPAPPSPAPIVTNGTDNF